MSRRMLAAGTLATAICFCITVVAFGNDGNTQSPKPAGQKPGDMAARRAGRGN